MNEEIVTFTDYNPSISLSLPLLPFDFSLPLFHYRIYHPHGSLVDLFAVFFVLLLWFSCVYDPCPVPLLTLERSH